MSGLRVIDSHTAGEPTRVVVSGGPDLGDGPIAGDRLNGCGASRHTTTTSGAR